MSYKYLHLADSDSDERYQFFAVVFAGIFIFQLIRSRFKPFTIAFRKLIFLLLGKIEMSNKCSEYPFSKTDYQSGFTILPGTGCIRNSEV